MTLETDPRRLFAYGTLIFPEVVSALLGRTPTHTAATLPSHARFALREREYPGLVPAEGASTSGILWEGISPGEFEILDHYESDLYECRQLAIFPGAGKTARDASVYVVPARYRNLLTTDPRDPVRFARDHLEETVEHCEHFRRSLADTGVC